MPKGAKLAEMPIERLTAFPVVANFRTATALGPASPPQCPNRVIG